MKSGEYQRLVATEWLQKLERENHSHATVLLEMVEDRNNEIKELQSAALIAEEYLLILEEEVGTLRNEAH